VTVLHRVLVYVSAYYCLLTHVFLDNRFSFAYYLLENYKLQDFKWQEVEREASEDIKVGRVKTFDCAEEGIKDKRPGLRQRLRITPTCRGEECQEAKGSQ